MEQEAILRELDYHRAQSITELLYQTGRISFVEYTKLVERNRKSFSPLFVDLLPKTLEQSSVQS